MGLRKVNGTHATLACLNEGGFSIDIEAPLYNDWTPAGDQARRQAGRLHGEPDLRRHAELAQLADRLGYRALWVRDVLLYAPPFGDAAQVFEVFSYLGYLAGITQNILLGTAALVLPIREPLLRLKSAATVQRLSCNSLMLGVARTSASRWRTGCLAHCVAASFRAEVHSGRLVRLQVNVWYRRQRSQACKISAAATSLKPSRVAMPLRTAPGR